MYTKDYVYRLKYMAEKNTTHDINFVCYTDDKTLSSIKTIELPEGLPGVWNKLYMFHNQPPIHGKNVYFDLDTIIQSNIDEILEYAPKSIDMVKRTWGKETDLISNNSSIMIWESNTQSHVWEHFSKDKEKHINFYSGIDTFFDHELSFDFLPEHWAYSFVWGDKPNLNAEPKLKILPQYMICMLNNYYSQYLKNHGKKYFLHYAEESLSQYGLLDYV